ncbi:MAG: LuxR C-terminal-related transcriptional regulator [candidate division Zixibacteria bacterium]|nr:LuxR C-terminal-related transcriptional regulator [candidate division Zixibacteria bacterium]
MGKRREFEFAEVPVDRLILESFANERSAYHLTESEATSTSALDKFRNRVNWHINNSLSVRQKQVIRAYLAGKKEREIADLLGVTQQVVNIYKHRAIKKLHKILHA